MYVVVYLATSTKCSMVIFHALTQFLRVVSPAEFIETGRCRPAILLYLWSATEYSVHYFECSELPSRYTDQFAHRAHLVRPVSVTPQRLLIMSERWLLVPRSWSLYVHLPSIETRFKSLSIKDPTLWRTERIEAFKGDIPTMLAKKQVSVSCPPYLPILVSRF